MLTGISGSKTVFRASTIPFSMSEGSTSGAGSFEACRSLSIRTPPSTLLGGDGLTVRHLGQRRQQGVPRQSGAFDPHGKFTDAGEDGELAQLRRAGACPGGEQIVEDVEEPA